MRLPLAALAVLAGAAFTASAAQPAAAHGVTVYAEPGYSSVYYGAHYVPRGEARRHWYYRHYREATVEPFKFYPYYFYTPRYIYTPHYAIKRSSYRRPRR